MKYKTYTHEIKITGSQIDVTDPCYDSDVWYRIKLPIIPGKYIAQADEIESNQYGKRISQLSLIREELYKKDVHEKIVGNIGVDAGLAGFFENKPDYNDKEWYEICDFLMNNNGNFYKCDLDSPLKCNGVFSSSGFGDGAYDVVELTDKFGEFVGYRIIYI